ncbi:hypothetical protein ACFQU7_13265 [Pseudoroseomonas wenyumeiae]
MVTFEGVGLTYDAARGAALSDLSFRVMPGEALVLAGPRALASPPFCAC